MKIALCIRPGYEDGGDGIQVIKTKEYLGMIHPELELEIITNPSSLDESFHIVHIFNYLTQEISMAFFKKAIELKLRIVSSPIYWDYSYSIMPLYMYFWCNKKYISERFSNFHRMLNPIVSKLPKRLILDSYTGVSNSFKCDVRFFIDNSLLLLPNSQEEGELCCQFAKRNNAVSKIRVVYNGVDVSQVKILDEDVFFEKYQIPRNYVLEVGRVEYLKNQMNLLASLKNHPEIPIVFLGAPKDHRPYTKQLKKMAKERENVYFINGVPHEEVYSFFKYARVHVLLSLRESPGLVNLEALSQGCPIVISDERFLPVKTYFKDNFISVNPFDLNQIETAIMTLYNSPRSTVDLSKFSWTVVAEQTYKAYEEILSD